MSVSCAELISVIVPVYNVEKYLKKCIESILGQTYQNIEIILVDDGSTDNSGKICDEYKKTDTRIKVVHKENGGLSDARNKGIDVSAGAYIMFVDSDDYISSKMVEILYERIIEDKADIAICNVSSVDEYYNDLNERNIHPPIKREVLNSSEAMCRISQIDGWNYVIACNKLYKRYIFLDIKFPYQKIHEDEFIIHRVFDKCARISCTDQALYYYVQRGESIMHKEYSLKRLDIAEAFYDRAEFCFEKGKYNIASAALSAMVDRLIFGYKRLDMHNPDNKKRFKELKKLYNKLYIKMLAFLFKYCSIKKCIKLTCFFVSVRISVYIISKVMERG